MAQKDKVKELVGRGLGSYHTKALQQIDRIEKKNKEQNHKISILTNELDNDYLTKTEEGSVISLDHSKEGMIYLDELQGNTLVNYCTDGAKELTLNGDIDVEGTSVTLTEGVDNGKVDVVCEGNTLVNCIENFSGIQNNAFTYENGIYKLIPNVSGGILLKANVKPSTTYTFIVNVHKQSNVKNILIDGHYLYSAKESLTFNALTGVAVFTTKDDLSTNTNPNYNFKLGTRPETTGELWINDFMILEGDWTNKEIPPYFEGMKSVGECEDNKIEILSRNDNLFVPTQHIPNGWSYGDMITSDAYRTYWIECKPNTTYFIESDKSGNRFGVSCSNVIKFGGVAFPVTKGEIYGSSDDTNKVVNIIFTTDSTAKYLFVYTTNNGVFPTPKIMISESSSEKTYIEPRLNKKEISLNEPLRSVGNTKDKIVKIDGKWYIERNCAEVIFDGSDDENWVIWSFDGFTNGYLYRANGIEIKGKGIVGDCSAIADKTYKNIIYISNSSLYDMTIHTSTQAETIVICDPRDINTFKQDLANNPITVTYLRKEPIYEPLEIEPTLNTYTDITHISNNSTIPCTMKIKNSGYNTIIKPSTQYTVALDTNKSGTIGINLSGAKVTTTNNVATITTPSTLTDDSLRLYGKGIKGSKVRLLEGDKTNWIPSHFEGMKSSFEDKLQEDGTYKMEFLSCNENLFNNDFNKRFENGDYVKSSPYIYFSVNVNKNKNYICYIDAKDLPLDAYCNIATRTYYDYPLFTTVFNATTEPNLTVTRTVSRTTLNNCNNKIYISLAFNKGNMQQVEEYLKSGKFKVKVVEQGNNLSFIPHKSNKIQFSSIEPLRGVGDVKDRFVFKDNKLMIERNCGEVVLNGNENYWQGCSYSYVDNIKYLRYYTNNDIGVMADSTLLCDNFNSSNESKGNSVFMNSVDGSFPNGIQFQIHPSSGCIDNDMNSWKQWLQNNPTTVAYQLKEPTYEEIPFELQKIILEGYENGTLFFDTNIPPTSTVTYAGETPIVKSVKLNKTEVSNNTTDINDNIVPYLMDMDYRVVCLQLEGGIENISMARLFGGTYEMLQRDIQSKRYSVDEYKYRLDAYLSANKITEDEYTKLGDMLNE